MGARVKTLFAVLVGFFCLTVTAASASELLSPAVYFKNPQHRLFSISPSGRFLALVRDLPFEEVEYPEFDEPEKKRRSRSTVSFIAKTRGDQILIYDLDEGNYVENINVPNQSVYWLHWASDDRILASISVSYDLNFGRNLTFELPASRTISMVRGSGGGDAVTLFANDRAVLRQNLFLSNIADPLPNDPDHVLMSAYRQRDLDLWRVNIVSGDAERVEAGTPRTFGWVTDSQSRAAFRLDKNLNGTLMHVFSRKNGGRWQKIITTRLNEKGEAPQFWPIARGGNEHEMYVLTSPPDQPRAAIATFDLRSGEIAQTTLSDNQYDFGGGLKDPSSGEYIGAWLIEDRYRLVLEDTKLQQHVDGVNAFFSDDANVRLIAADRKLSRLLFEVSSPTIPGDIYFYDRAARHIEPLFDTRPKLGEDNLARVDIATYQARDGQPIRAYITHPVGVAPDAPAPLIVCPHGGPAARDAYDFNPTTQFLASRGYRVLQPNFRGSSGYGRQFETAGDHEWGGLMQTDVIDGLTYVRDQGLIGSNKTCIMGTSYGGYVALYAAMTASDLFDCAISIAGVTDLPDIIEYARDTGRDEFAFAKKLIGDPRADKDILAARSPARHAKEISIPLLIIHGRLDNIVPYAQAKKLADALDAEDFEYEWFDVVDGHSFSRLGSTVQSMRRIERFLGEHLGGAVE